MLELAVAVELVAKQVAEDDEPRLELGRYARKPRLVDLEEALGAVLLEERGRDSPGHVRAGAIVNRLPAGGAQGGADTAGCGGLPVWRAPHRGAARVPPSQLGGRLGGPPPHQPSRKGRAAAPAPPAGKRARGSRDRQLRAEEVAHLERGPTRAPGRAMTSSARGSSLIRAGRSARWSPSA